jgi:hypothetical protein
LTAPPAGEERRQGAGAAPAALPPPHVAVYCSNECARADA